MYELQEFEKHCEDKAKKRGSIRQALEDGSQCPVPLQLPKMAEFQREDRCCKSTKLVAAFVVLSLIAMLFYAIWRIRSIEEPSETSDYDYRMIDEGEINDSDTSDNSVDKT